MDYRDDDRQAVGWCPYCYTRLRNISGVAKGYCEFHGLVNAEWSNPEDKEGRVAYMRGTFYVWSDGDNMHINGVVMPGERFDELVAMRWAEMTPGEKHQAKSDAVEYHGGNFGCVALCEEMSVPTAMDRLAELVEADE